MNKRNFLTGAMILTIAGLGVKVIGAINKIFISRLLGGEGIGLYQMAYQIYFIAMNLAIAGIPIALSLMIAEKIAKKDIRGAYKIFKVSFVTLAISGIAFGILLYISADLLHHWQIIYDERVIKSIKVLAPAIPIAAMLSCYRGYFQGFQDMLPTGISQIAEQLVRVVFMVGLTYIFLDYGLENAAAGASMATIPATMGAFLIMLYFFIKNKKHVRIQLEEQILETTESIKSIIKRLITLALPVSIANLLMPLLAFIDLYIVPQRLVLAGYSIHQATEAYGYLAGMANSLINLPIIVTMALAASLVPAISEARALQKKDLINRRITMAIKITNIFAVPAVVGLFVLASPISLMLYATNMAGPPIAVLSFSIFLLGLQQVTTGVLQGLGKPIIPMINLIMSMAVKIVLTWIFTSMLGINGAALGTDINFAVALILNLIFIYHYTGYKINFRELLKIVMNSLIMGGLVYSTYTISANIVGNNMAIIMSIVLAAISYVYGIICLSIVDKTELREMPLINKIVVKLTKEK